MFMPGEDFYFLTYNTIVFLSELGCISAKNSFRDYRKIAYLADIVSSESIMRFVSYNFRSKPGNISMDDRHYLSLLYDHAVSRGLPLRRLIYALSKKGILAICPDEEQKSIYISDMKSANVLLSSGTYALEQKHVRELKLLIPRIRTLKLSTLIDKLFSSYGVTTWED